VTVSVNMHTAKSDLSRLVRQALEGEDIVIMRAGKPVARIVPIPNARVPGLAKGHVRIASDFDAPLPAELLEAFEGNT
jgi:prevent-host-death family protein